MSGSAKLASSWHVTVASDDLCIWWYLGLFECVYMDVNVLHISGRHYGGITIKQVLHAWPDSASYMLNGKLVQVCKTPCGFILQRGQVDNLPDTKMLRLTFRVT